MFVSVKIKFLTLKLAIILISLKEKKFFDKWFSELNAKSSTNSINDKNGEYM